jgi:hypothetical protein
MGKKAFFFFFVEVAQCLAVYFCVFFLKMVHATTHRQGASLPVGAVGVPSLTATNRQITHSAHPTVSHACSYTRWWRWRCQE